MSAPIDWSTLKGHLSDDPNLVTIEATVVTGFESAAKLEAIEKFNLSPDNNAVVKHQGRILFDLDIARVPEVK